MKSYLKFLSRNKLYTLVNVVGLSVSLAFVIIIGLYAQMEFGRDKWHAKADRIYSICTESEGEVDEYCHWCMQGLLRSNFPEIENSCAVLNHDA
jgi:putative ABC transport system permease protein